MLAGAEHGVPAVEAADGGAAGTGNPFVALRVSNVAEIRAARALQHVTAEARHVAELLAGCELQ